MTWRGPKGKDLREDKVRYSLKVSARKFKISRNVNGFDVICRGCGALVGKFVPNFLLKELPINYHSEELVERCAEEHEEKCHGGYKCGNHSSWRVRKDGKCRRAYRCREAGKSNCVRGLNRLSVQQVSYDAETA